MSQVAPTSTSDEGGFTLAEMLVALALFALLATLLFSNVRFGVQAWAIGSARTEQIDQIGASRCVYWQGTAFLWDHQVQKLKLHHDDLPR